MRNVESEKGVTLISLVVTIVVILILAGITVNYTIGDNGIVKIAKQIENDVTQAEIEGQEKIDKVKSEEEYIEDGVTNLPDEKDPSINSFEITNITKNSFTIKVNVTETGSGLAKIEYSKNDGVNYETDLKDNTSKSYTFKDLEPNKDYIVKVKVTDKEGNFSEKSQEIKTKSE